MKKSSIKNNSNKESRSKESIMEWLESSESHNYEIELESEETTIRRSRIQFKMGHSARNAWLQLAEVDALTLLTLGASESFFSKLREEGIESVLINHFALCEQKREPYYKYENRKRELKELLFKHDAFSDESSDGPFKNKSKIDHQYRLVGGMNSYYWIISHDPIFFTRLCEAVTKGLCTIKRLDVCLDHSEDIMDLVAEEIKAGKVRGFGSHLRGYGSVDGRRFSNSELGIQSLFHRKFIRACGSFRLDTLYCGHSKRSPCVIVFYDKKKEQVERKYRQYLDSTRIEIRLYSRKKNTSYDEIIKRLFFSLSFPRTTLIGQGVRHYIFTSVLFSHINFSTKQKVNFNNLFESGCAHWSPWFLDLFKICLKGCLDSFDFKDKSVMENRLFLPVLMPMIDNLPAYKGNPNKIISDLPSPDLSPSTEHIPYVSYEEIGESAPN